MIKEENGANIYEEKIKREINNINENENCFKIDNLTIMLVGKRGVGKSTLINQFLKLEGSKKAKTGVGSFQTTIITSYENASVPFLRLIDTRGIELNI